MSETIGFSNRFRLQAVLCAFALLACALISRPYVDMGMNDDFAFIHMAKTTARMGHITYDGYSFPMLGWMLVLSSTLIRIFGFSFALMRFETVAIGMITAFLMQRVAVRAGLNEWNSTLATLTLVVSPLFIPLTVSLMTDVGGLFCIVLCAYLCIRALEARTDRTAALWLCSASLSNAVGGTIRQIIWLGVLVMVPSAMWLLRKRRFVILTAGAAELASLAFLLAAMRWFKHQLYSLPGDLVPPPMTGRHMVHLTLSVGRLLVDSPIFLIPVLLPFVFLLRRGTRKTILYMTVATAICIVSAVLIAHSSKSDGWLAPYGGNYVMATGAVDGTHLQGQRPVVLGKAIRLLVTVVAMGSLIAFLGLRLQRGSHPPSLSAEAAIKRKNLSILLIPFATAYLALLIQHAIFEPVFDRYLLALLFVWILLSVRFHQDYFAPRLPFASLAIIVLLACYGTAATHDVFVLFRARQQAIAELRGSGVPDNQIDGGFEYDGWTQLEAEGHVNDERIQVPSGTYIPRKNPNLACPMQGFDMFPAVTPRYSLSYTSTACFGESEKFAPVTYKTWLSPHTGKLYVVNSLPPSQQYGD